MYISCGSGIRPGAKKNHDDDDTENTFASVWGLVRRLSPRVCAGDKKTRGQHTRFALLRERSVCGFNHVRFRGEGGWWGTRSGSDQRASISACYRLLRSQLLSHGNTAGIYNTYSNGQRLE